MLIKLLCMKKMSLNLKNQKLIIDFMQFIKSMITVACDLKIGKSIIKIYLGALREYHLYLFKAFELFLIFSRVLLKVYRFLLSTYYFPL